MDLVDLTAIPNALDLASLEAIPDPLERAVAADQVMWLGPRTTSAQARALRRAALVEALTLGEPVENVAARMRVHPSDVRTLAGL